jgi:hypothetical protein
MNDVTPEFVPEGHVSARPRLTRPRPVYQAELHKFLNFSDNGLSDFPALICVK